MSKRALPFKIVRNTDGIRPECKIKGDDSMPPSIWSESPSKSRPQSFLVTESQGDAGEEEVFDDEDLLFSWCQEV